MIYDRPYMRSDFDRREASTLHWVIGTTVGAFILQHLASLPWFGGSETIAQYFALSLPALEQGGVWTLATYGFLHTSIWHLLVSAVAVYVVGREIIPLLGRGRFIGLYAGGLIAGGLGSLAFWSATRIDHQAFGATAAACALLAAFARLYPDRQFALPLTAVVLKPQHFVHGVLVVTAIGMLTSEWNHPGDAVAYSSHLGGLLAGWVYSRFWHGRVVTARVDDRANIELPAWLRKRKSTAAATNYKVNVSRPVDIKAEVDRILDKINSQGFGSLTEQERRLLDEARELLNKR